MRLSTHDDYVFVADISHSQGKVDFRVMRAAGIEGVIIRASNAFFVDNRFATYYRDALAAGYTVEEDIAFYVFINPARATAMTTASTFTEAVFDVVGHLDVGLMEDIEDYTQEPNLTMPILKGETFASWLRLMHADIGVQAPLARRFAYSNQAYYDPWVGDPTFAASLPWIVSRYPVYGAKQCAERPVPPNPADWAAWAFKQASDGPHPPTGATASAWQFSAGHNGMGRTYGVQSADIDLNLIPRPFWHWITGRDGRQQIQRQTGTIVVPTPITPITPATPITPIAPSGTTEDSMYRVVVESPKNALQGYTEYNANFIGWASSADDSILSLIWVDGRPLDDGSTPGVDALKMHLANGAVRRTFPLAKFHTFFVNRLPPEGADMLHDWTLHDVAGVTGST